MRAIYLCCRTDPWIKVAESLQRLHGITPVYWLGFVDDDSEGMVKNAFPNALYHAYFEAWKGVFPMGIDSESFKWVIDPEQLNAWAAFELQALHLMDRMDNTQSDFSYQERRLLFRKFLRSWSYIIDRFKVDLVISPNVPHRSFDFPLYLVCRRQGIPMLSFVSTPFMNAARIIPVSDLYALPEQIRIRFEQKDGHEMEPLVEDIQASVSRIQQDYDSAKPKTFEEFNRHHKKKPSILLTAQKFFSEVLSQQSPWLGRTGWLWKGVPTYHKKRNKDVELSKSRQFLVSYVFKIYKRVLYLKKLEAEYRTLSRTPDLSEKFVYVALHYQPEATTSPKAGIYADHLYLLELISRYLPKDYAIYVKENPKQFNPIAEGNTARPLRFYRDALKIPRVQLVAADFNPFDLIDRSQAVFSLAGTVGWEGMVRGKPVVCFAPSWYEYYTPGVLRVRDLQDWARIAQFIEEYRFNEIALNHYLKTIEENSICAYFRSGLKKYVDMDEASCVEALSASLAAQMRLS